jgi:hypothetical protein
VEPERGLGRRPFLAGRLAEDTGLLAEVETAEKLGISLKRFRGWEPVTTYVHRGGRLASSQPEPEWDEQEQGWMLALRMYRLSLCPACTGDLNVTTAAENEERFHRLPPLQCFRCLEFARSHDEWSDEKHPLTYLHLVPRAPS